MNPKYFNRVYKEGVDDCWTLVQDIFKDEHGFLLPDLPICETDNHDVLRDSVLANVDLVRVDAPVRGCIVAFRKSRLKWHCGYALNNRLYLHSTKQKVTASPIPRNAHFYKVRDVK